MKNVVYYMTLTIALVGLSMIMAQAQVSKKEAATELNTKDKNFVAAAAQGGIAEVQLGKLAEQKASNPAVKEFGSTMVRDHMKVNGELKQEAEKIGVTLPTTVGSQDREEKARLSKLSGAAFDKAYMRDMVKDHRADVAAFRREASRGRNKEIKSFASETVPTLEKHLQMAEKVNLKAEGKAS